MKWLVVIGVLLVALHGAAQDISGRYTYTDSLLGGEVLILYDNFAYRYNQYGNNSLTTDTGSYKIAGDTILFESIYDSMIVEDNMKLIKEPLEDSRVIKGDKLYYLRPGRAHEYGHGILTKEK